MKSVLMLALFCFMILFFLGSPESAEKGTGPQMVMTETSHDFGEVDQGALVEHSFTVMNRGDQVLEIKSVNPG